MVNRFGLNAITRQFNGRKPASAGVNKQEKHEEVRSDNRRFRFCGYVCSCHRFQTGVGNGHFRSRSREFKHAAPPSANCQVQHESDADAVAGNDSIAAIHHESDADAFAGDDSIAAIHHESDADAVAGNHSIAETENETTKSSANKRKKNAKSAQLGTQSGETLIAPGLNPRPNRILRNETTNLNGLYRCYAGRGRDFADSPGHR
jgi:hypothetical protein